jgi:hypothetical protein
VHCVHIDDEVLVVNVLDEANLASGAHAFLPRGSRPRGLALL